MTSFYPKKRTLSKALFICMFWLLSNLTAQAGADGENIFFARLEEISYNNRIISSKLHIQPVNSAFLSEKFKEYKWSIIVDPDRSEKEIINSAIKAFLTRHGKVFIENRTNKINSSIEDVTKTDFDGYFLGDVIIDKIELKENSKKVFLHALFVPVADIEKKEEILLMRRLKNIAEEIKSFFIY